MSVGSSSSGVEQGPPVAYAEKPVTLESLARLNKYDTVGRMLERYLAGGHLDDYDSEHANRFRDAIKIVRGICALTDVPLSLAELEAKQAACEHEEWEQFERVMQCRKCEIYAPKGDGKRTAEPDSEAAPVVSSLSNDFISSRFMKQE